MANNSSLSIHFISWGPGDENRKLKQPTKQNKIKQTKKMGGRGTGPTQMIKL